MVTMVFSPIQVKEKADDRLNQAINVYWTAIMYWYCPRPNGTYRKRKEEEEDAIYKTEELII